MTSLYFSDHFGVTPDALEGYGACDISLVSDLPFFVDPFLLFHSDKPEYQRLHEQIIRYVMFLRDRAADSLTTGDIDNWYAFKEVKQNWLGFTYLGNRGSGLGRDFAQALNRSFQGALRNFGQETVTRSSHLEKLALIKSGVGRDNISDLTTNLIKGYLLEFTQAFALEHLAFDQRETFTVRRASFDYDTGVWRTGRYTLPILGQDFVLLTPLDMLTRDDTWINYTDMVHKYHLLPEALPDAQLRAQIDQYFRSFLHEKSTPKDHERAAQNTFARFPQLLDYYIRGQEDDGDQAKSVSEQKRRETEDFLIHLVKTVVGDMADRSDFLTRPATSYQECLAKVLAFKQYVENQDGYQLINPPGDTRRPSNEKDVQLFFGLLMSASPLDVNREANNGRGPVDFAVSAGRFDKSLIEVKLGSNSQLKRNLEKQVEVYKRAHGTPHAVKMIVCYTERDQARVSAAIQELGLADDESVVVIDARHDNKPSASKA